MSCTCSRMHIIPNVDTYMIYKAIPSQSLVSGHTTYLKYMQAGGWLGLCDYVTIKLRQEEEVLKPYHR